MRFLCRSAGSWVHPQATPSTPAPLDLGEGCAAGQTVGDGGGGDARVLLPLTGAAGSVCARAAAEELHDGLPEVLVDDAVEDEVGAEVDGLERIDNGDTCGDRERRVQGQSQGLVNLGAMGVVVKGA